ncbi:MAG: hypothetical protein IID44_26460 [Planctomycetes bacterium]|nr:hypothetical protein [Planctomycetota bacterium]
MMKLSVDAEFQAKLTQAGGPLEICDQSGHTIGFFQPVPPPGQLKKMSPFSDDQIEQFQQQRTGRPLPEIWNDLEIRHGT